MSTKEYTFNEETGECQVFTELGIPEAVWEIAEKVKILDLQDGKRNTLPEDLPRFSNLVAINCSKNAFSEISTILRDCSSLEIAIFNACHIQRVEENAFPEKIRAISLTNNRLNAIPSSIGQYQKLEKITLAGNQLEDLPLELLDCGSLSMVRVAVNQLKSSPNWLFQHPKLAWFTDSANQYSHSAESLLLDMPTVQWDSIELGELIGESRKSKVYSAKMADGKKIALKFFDSYLSTDGVIEDDIASSLLAGQHESVVGGIARVVGAPDGKTGLVMPLVSSEYSSLGNLPTYTSLTRDVFDMKFSANVIDQVIEDIANAMFHLSKLGIMHGDIYAHNILSNPQGKSMLGDFGCASLYTPKSHEGELRERIDVLGFGYLIEDLIQHASEQVSTDLVQLKERCLDSQVEGRPSFDEICKVLR